MPDEQIGLTFDPTVLLDAEIEVLTRTAQGEIATFSGEPMPVLRAAFLRHLLLGLPAPHEAWPVRLPVVRILGARTDAWVKVVPIHTAALTILGFQAGSFGPHSVTLLQHPDGAKTSVKTKDFATLQQIAANP